MLQEEQRQLGNGRETEPEPRAGAGLHRTGSLPLRGRAELAQDQDKDKAEPGGRLEPVAEVSAAKGAYSPRKRASLPAITPNLCRQPPASLGPDKRASGPSPRLEGFRNDISPLREVADQSPEAEQCAGHRTLQDGVSDKTFENSSFVPADRTAS